jgi:1-acyl-sn-glycerol-3-phosphate acyltransferase
MGSKKYQHIPHGYYPKRAAQRPSRLLEAFGREVAGGFLEKESGPLKVQAPPSVRQFGAEHRTGIILSTHRSWTDIVYAVEATQVVGIERVRQVSKLENLQVHPVASWFLHKVGMIALDRDHPDIEGLASTLPALIRHGESALLYGEGTRVKNDVHRVGRLRRTPAMLALQYNLPVILLSMVGNATGETRQSERSLRGHHLGVPTAPVAVFGEVVHLEPLPPHPTDKQLMLATGAATRGLQGQLQALHDQAYELREGLLAAA